MTKPDDLFVIIVEKKTKRICTEMKAGSIRIAEKLERGAGINLNHNDFSVQTVTRRKLEKMKEALAK